MQTREAFALFAPLMQYYKSPQLVLITQAWIKLVNLHVILHDAKEECGSTWAILPLDKLLDIQVRWEKAMRTK